MGDTVIEASVLQCASLDGWDKDRGISVTACIPRWLGQG